MEQVWDRGAKAPAATQIPTAWSVILNQRAGPLGEWSCSCLRTIRCWTPGLGHPAISHLSPSCLPWWENTWPRSSLFIRSISVLTHTPTAEWYPEHPQISHETPEGLEVRAPYPSSASCLGTISSQSSLISLISSFVSDTMLGASCDPHILPVKEGSVAAASG